MGRTEDAIFPDVADVVIFGWRHVDGSGILNLNKRKAQIFDIFSHLRRGIDDSCTKLRYFHQAETSAYAEVK